VRNTVADWTQQSRSILDEDKVPLFVYRPHKVGELELAVETEKLHLEVRLHGMSKGRAKIDRQKSEIIDDNSCFSSTLNRRPSYANECLILLR
jgi:hypothetical protein